MKQTDESNRGIRQVLDDGAIFGASSKTGPRPDLFGLEKKPTTPFDKRKLHTALIWRFFLKRKSQGAASGFWRAERVWNYPPWQPQTCTAPLKRRDTSLSPELQSPCVMLSRSIFRNHLKVKNGKCSRAVTYLFFPAQIDASFIRSKNARIG